MIKNRRIILELRDMNEEKENINNNLKVNNVKEE